MRVWQPFDRLRLWRSEICTFSAHELATISGCAMTIRSDFSLNQSFTIEKIMHHSKTECTVFDQFTSKVAPEGYNAG